MAYCPSCGSNVEGRFCAKCGTAVPAQAAPPPASAPAAYGSGAGAPPPPGYNPPPPGYNPPPPGNNPPPPPGYGAAPPPPPPPGYGNQPPGYGQPGYGQQQGYPPPQYAAAPGLQENVASALCYILGFITGIIFLVLAPYNQNRNIKFHAWQSIFFSGAVIAVGIVFSMFIWNIGYGFGLWTLITMVYLVFRLAMFVLWLYVMFKAYNGQKFMLPVIGPIAEKQANS
jgi:uncharacterized membrane protein